ncbi:hypothetical protein KP003_09570 [Geomonas nitrogeniifigens]|uniref:Uncharacterized protein n=1 Tax=Geomonas diazotrophica TaxID=2843197 RepID=A0ABX8JS85_9BACT|nr:hypothetical protein [Geomonas nitrogeniifigens]QWV99447.1 hypothetical protein KP005_09275 [Geomonas nitrogeniifigens]QXE88623.1 hypothetical protein KP003_09570 [Geomonas nitrogeniifigens]
MIFFAILLKAVLWVIVFRSAVRCDARAMLLRCSCIAVALTVIDIFSVAANLRFSAFVLTLALYLLMSFTLIPCAWKLRNTLATLLLGVAGTLGALAGVNFTMDLLRGLVPFLNR